MTTRSEDREAAARLLATGARALSKARAADADAKSALRAAAVEAAAAGMPETEIAERAGVTRRTVRTWLGK